MPEQILPGATIGVLGGGQLGRMLCDAARRMGYRVVIFDADEHSPAGAIADEHICAGWEDIPALDRLAETCDVITTEFENIPAETVTYLASRCRVAPDASALEIAQHRAREKSFARNAGLQPAEFVHLNYGVELAAAAEQIGFPAILKSATLGYDGKGQSVVHSMQELETAFAQIGDVECVLEQLVDIQAEISVIVARNASGETACFPPAENVHVNGILHTSTVPAALPEHLIERAQQQATSLALALDYIGVLAVEFFIDSDGELLFNEMAPRTHNSGHYTQDACLTSQFEQQVRMICGLTPGDTRLLTPVVMVNLLGDLWHPDWSVVMQRDAVKLHLYGKSEARRGRKMGHFNVLASSREEAAKIAEAVFAALSAQD